MNILPASAADAAELLEIYRPYVEQTAVTFEYEVPTLEDFTSRIVRTTAAFPYLKAVDDAGRILGYAYAGRFHPRKAYDWSAEASVYVRMDARRCGCGRALYEALEKILREMGVLNLNACIAVPQQEDAHLTMDSPCFHEAMGYTLVGRFHSCGYKFDTWYDMIWMEKMLGAHPAQAQPVRFGHWKPAEPAEKAEMWSSAAPTQPEESGGQASNQSAAPASDESERTEESL